MDNTYNNYIGRGWTRHEAFADILRRNPPRSEYRSGDIVVLNVKFNYYGNTYCYVSKDDVYRPGDLVEVLVQGNSKIVTVESVGYYSEEEYPFKGVMLNTVIGPAKGDLAEKYRETIESERKKEEDYEKVRAKAKVMLEEARRLKSQADEESRAAQALKEEAEHRLAEAREMMENARAAREAAIAVNREIIERALAGLEDRMSRVKNKAEQLSASRDTSDHTISTIEKLNSVYLPDTKAVIDHYREIFSEVIPEKDVLKLRTEALEAIDKYKEVYDNILASLFERDMLELYSEMRALRTIFEINGLTDSDFDISL